MNPSSNDNATSASAIQIFGKHFNIKCPVDKIDMLQKCARYVDHKMRQVRENSHGKITGVERIAMMTALEICHELMALQQQKDLHIETMNAKIRELQTKVETALQAPTTSSEEVA